MEPTFIKEVEPLRGALRVHCYRMLGSSHDSDDMVQETMLRAWRSREQLKDRSTLRPWLYRIATNVCLDELNKRPRRMLASDAHPPAVDPAGPIVPPIEEPVWLEMMPSAWLDEAGSPDPSARYELRESVALAFVAALQMLSPVQRATLLLRDVVGLSAEETAEVLELSVSAANSALFRARTAVEEKRSAFAPAATEVNHELLVEYVRAFEQSDLGALMAILHDEVKTTMPPSPMWVDGIAANALFYEKMLAPAPAGYYKVVPTHANGSPAFGFYRPSSPPSSPLSPLSPLSPSEPRTLRAINVVSVRDGKIARIDHFMMRKMLAVFRLPDQA